MNDDVFAFERYLDDKSEDSCLIVVNRSEYVQGINFDLDCDILDEIGVKYSPGDYGQTLEKEDGRFTVDIMPKSYMIFKMKNIEEK